MTRDDVVDASGGHDKGTGKLLRRVNCELGDRFCVVLNWQNIEAYYMTFYRQQYSMRSHSRDEATMTLRTATLHDVFSGFDVSDTSLTA